MSFLNFTGDVRRKNNEYYYFVKNKDNMVKATCMTKIRNPIIDNIFKYTFSENDKLLINLMTCLFFTGDEEIKSLIYLPNEYHSVLRGKHGKGSLKIDIGVKCKIGKKFEKENFINIQTGKSNYYEMIINVEIQIGIKEENDKRFIGYAAALYSKYEVVKVWVIVFLIDPERITFNQINKILFTFLTKKSIPQLLDIQQYDILSIIQIYLNYYYKLLNENYNIWILDSNNFLDRKGEEWIKFLTIPLWCASEDEYYLLPNILQKGFIENNYVLDSIIRISDLTDDLIIDYKNTSDLLEQKQKIIKIQKIINDKDELIKYLKAKNDELTKEIELLRKGKNVIESKKTGILQINKNNKKYPKK